MRKFIGIDKYVFRKPVSATVRPVQHGASLRSNCLYDESGLTRRIEWQTGKRMEEYVTQKTSEEKLVMKRFDKSDREK